MRRWKQVQGVRLIPEEHAEILGRIASGQRQRTIAEEMGCSERSIRRLLARPRQAARPPRQWSDHRLSLDEREEISLGLA